MNQFWLGFVTAHAGSAVVVCFWIWWNDHKSRQELRAEMDRMNTEALLSRIATLEGKVEGLTNGK